MFNITIKMLNKALQLAIESEDKKHKFCSIITDKRNRILSIGFNSFQKTHPIQQKFAKKCGCEEKMYLHSEVAAIIALDYNAKPYNIYIARTNKSGNKGLLAKPCEICKKIIAKTSIKNIYYTGE